MTAPELVPLRERIDRIDERIAELLSQRFELTRQVGEIKAAIGEAPVDAERQLQRGRWLGEIAARHGIDEEMIRQLFAVIRSFTVAGHERIASGCQAAQRFRPARTV